MCGLCCFIKEFCDDCMYIMYITIIWWVIWSGKSTKLSCFGFQEMKIWNIQITMILWWLILANLCKWVPEGPIKIKLPYSHWLNKGIKSSNKATLTKIISNMVQGTQALAAAGNQLVNHVTPEKFMIKTNLQNQLCQCIWRERP